MVTILRISGMTSVHAVRAVFTALAGVEGVQRADVALGRAMVEHDGQATPAALAEAIALAGYQVMEWKEDRRSLPIR
jgi:copper chaperone CopZ